MSELSIIKELIKGHQHITIEDVIFPPRKISDHRNGTLKQIKGYLAKDIVVIRYQYGKQLRIHYITFVWPMRSICKSKKHFLNKEIEMINKVNNQNIQLI